MNKLARIWLGTWRGIAAVGSGLLLASAYPPIASSEAAWMAFVPLLLVAWYTKPALSFRYGFVSGAVFWLCSLSWLLALGRTGAPPFLAFLGWVSLALYCALYTGVFLLLSSYLIATLGVSGKTSFRGLTSLHSARQSTLLILIPLAWIGAEYGRSVLFTGFPWNALGISQYRHAGLIQIAEWGGVYAVSGLIMLVNAGLTMTLLRFVDTYFLKRPSKFHPELMIALLALLLCLVRGVRTVREQSRIGVDEARITVRLIQPNIPQIKKWPETFSETVYDSLREKTELALMGGIPHLIVWPETALPDLVENNPRAATFVRDLASRGAPLLVGSMELGEQDEAPVFLKSGTDGETRLVDDRDRPWIPRYYNTAFLFDSRGELAGRYRKRHLVPFGEYLPFDKRIAFMRRLAPLGFSCDAGDEAVVFRLPPVAKKLVLQDSSDTSDRSDLSDRAPASGVGPERDVAFSVLICFEDVFAYLSRDAVRAGARFLVNQTNDAWFDGTSASVQHISHAVFRCVENRVPMARSANTGVTGFIDRAGRLDEATRDMIQAGTTAQTHYRTDQVRVPGPDMPLTFYTRYGDRFFAQPAALATALGLIALGARRRFRRETDM